MKAAIGELERDKAPRPNGFAMEFWVFSKEIVKEEVMGSSRSFLRKEILKFC